MITTDIDKLRKPCRETLPEEVGNVIQQLEAELKQHPTGIGLATNQIGLDAKVAIIRIPDKEKIDLINPKIIEYSKEIVFYQESCLSLPDLKKPVTTQRYEQITIENGFDRGKYVLYGMEAIACQHECLPYRSLIETENGLMMIGKMVNNKYKGKVLSYNGDLVYSNIIGWSKRRHKNGSKKNWILLKFSYTGPNKQLLCTKEHLCASLPNIFEGAKSIKFLPAQKMLGKYIVRKINIRNTNSEHPLYNKEQLSIMVGSLLGDLCIDSKGQCLFNHGIRQKEYAIFKQQIFGGKIVRGYSGYRNNFSNYTLILPITEQTKELRKRVYQPNKRVGSIIKFINKKSLAFWYMDDGCLLKKVWGKELAQFHTEGFEKKDILLLVNILKKKFNLEAGLRRRKIHGKIRYAICLNTYSSTRFFKLIAPYICKSMDYKLPKRFISAEKYNFDIQKLPYSCKKVIEIKIKENYESARYDIKVKDTHNFFANGSLVHNCDHLNGLLITDRQAKPYTRPSSKIGRNERCATCDVKYKRHEGIEHGFVMKEK